MRTKLFWSYHENAFYLDASDIGAVVEEREDGRVNVSDVVVLLEPNPNKNIKVKMLQVSCEQM